MSTTPCIGVSVGSTPAPPIDDGQLEFDAFCDPQDVWLAKASDVVGPLLIGMPLTPTVWEIIKPQIEKEFYDAGFNAISFSIVDEPFQPWLKTYKVIAIPPAPLQEIYITASVAIS